MEMILNEGFCEMSEDVMIETTGGGGIIKMAETFLANKLSYTVLNHTMKNGSLIRVPGGNVGAVA